MKQWSKFRFSPSHNWKISAGDMDEKENFIDCGMDFNSEANANLIISAVNACIEINPDNPMAVALSIKDMYEKLKALGITNKLMVLIDGEWLEASKELIDTVNEIDKTLGKKE